MFPYGYDLGYKSYLQSKLSKPKPWVGVYTAAASVVCSLAMAADVAVAFWTKRLWVPCTYFCMDALSLTLLSVAMKLPLDFSAVLDAVEDKVAHISGLALMPAAMSHCMTSLGSMKNHEIIANLAALGLLVFTVAGNLVMRLTQIYPSLDRDYTLDTVDSLTTLEEIVTAIFMLFVFLLSCSSAVMVCTVRHYVESKYQDMHRTIVLDRGEDGWGKIMSMDELKLVVQRYWVMAETGSLQFVIARSVIPAATGVVCLMTAVVLLEVILRLHIDYLHHYKHKLIFSDYKWSTIGILLTQCIGVAFGMMPPLLRSFMTAQFRSTKTRNGHYKLKFEVEKYWTQLLVEWRESPLPYQLRNPKFRKLAHDTKRLLLNLCIGLQTLIVRISKLLLLISAAVVATVCWCFHLFTKFKVFGFRGSTETESVAATTVQHLKKFIILLEDEEDLPEKTINNMYIEIDRMIQKGRKKKPENLIKLLGKSTSFNGVREFDSKQIPSLHSPELPNSWSLPVVTLTSIAIAFSRITSQESSQLLRGVSEGLEVIKLVEKTLDRTGVRTSIRKAADVVWVDVELYGKWLDKDIRTKTIPSGQTHLHMLQEFSDEAKKIVLDFINDSDEMILKNPNNWKFDAIAANCMYRISQTLMQDDNNGLQCTEEQLFDRLSIMVSDILAACLTNLVHVIFFNCYSNSIKDRQRNVHEAAILLGKSEEILEILQQHELPCLDLDKVGNIDEWRADFENPTAASFTQN